MVVVGLVLVPLPCPGWAIVFAGVAPLGTEFSWGERLLEEILRRLAPATALLHRLPCAVRTLADAAAAGGVVASVGLFLGAARRPSRPARHQRASMPAGHSSAGLIPAGRQRKEVDRARPAAE